MALLPPIKELNIESSEELTSSTYINLKIIMFCLENHENLNRD
jgi:hypothetical protein